MKAKKTEPKSIRFNKINLETSLKNGGFESIQELIDFLLEEYAKKGTIEANVNPQPNNVMENLKKIINKPAQKNYFDSSKGIDGITNRNLPF